MSSFKCKKEKKNPRQNKQNKTTHSNSWYNSHYKPQTKIFYTSMRRNIEILYLVLHLHLQYLLAVTFRSSLQF